MSDIITRRQRAPWWWPDWIYNVLGEGKEHAKRLKILHSFTAGVSNFSHFLLTLSCEHFDPYILYGP